MKELESFGLDMELRHHRVLWKVLGNSGREGGSDSEFPCLTFTEQAVESGVWLLFLVLAPSQIPKHLLKVPAFASSSLWIVAVLYLSHLFLQVLIRKCLMPWELSDKGSAQSNLCL